VEIAGRTFLVTGGGSGLGAATARGLKEAGAKVLVADLNTEVSEKLVAEIGDAARFVETDVTDEKSAHAAIDTAVHELGGLHGVVNCAGVAIGEKVLGRNGPHELESFTKVLQINLVGTFNVIRLAAAVMKWNEPVGGPEGSGERGVIVNTASVAAFEGQVGQAAYAASKGGVVSMTLPIARELASYGIRVVTIAPGIFDTPMMVGLPEEARESLGEQVPFPSRLGRPEEYGALVRHVIENEMLNGEVIRLDGAIRMTAR
jgi:NAD(P)-dependent dehydrogenase (short-subunit alcohol dehydrogenase family)